MEDMEFGSGDIGLGVGNAGKTGPK